MESGKLLIVDDDADVSKYLATIAGDIGYDARIAASLEKLREELPAFDPGVLLLDLQLPDADGIQILRFLSDSGSRARILLISGIDRRTLDSVLRLGGQMGLAMIGALKKPFTAPELRKALGDAAARSGEISECSLREGIAAGQLVMRYQPKVRFREDGSWFVAGFEALVRWQHPQLGELSPDRFIPLAESDDDLMLSMTEETLRLSLQQLRAFHEKGFKLSMAVNVSPRLLHDLDFPDRVHAITAEQGADPAYVMLEVTESAVMKDEVHSMDILSRLRLKGFSLSIDDFGTGYSSLVQLYQMPFNELKIDRSFVTNCDKDKDASILVRSITDLAHNLGLSVCAEGVERQETAAFLQSLGCEIAQGYLFSPPAHKEGVMAFLHSHEGVIEKEHGTKEKRGGEENHATG